MLRDQTTEHFGMARTDEGRFSVENYVYSTLNFR